MIMKVDSYLVELIAFGTSYEELLDLYMYTKEEIADACLFIMNTPFDLLMEMLENAALLRQSMAC